MKNLHHQYVCRRFFCNLNEVIEMDLYGETDKEYEIVGMSEILRVCVCVQHMFGILFTVRLVCISLSCLCVHSNVSY